MQIVGFPTGRLIFENTWEFGGHLLHYKIFENFGGHCPSENLEAKKNQRTNGPVYAHLRSAVYTNKHVKILWKITSVKGQMRADFLFT